MSMYHSPEILRMLNQERQQEIADARRASLVGQSAPRLRFTNPMRRLFVRQPAQADCAC
jgi:hypothetical protein